MGFYYKVIIIQRSIKQHSFTLIFLSWLIKRGCNTNVCPWIHTEALVHMDIQSDQFTIDEVTQTISLASSPINITLPGTLSMAPLTASVICNLLYRSNSQVPGNYIIALSATSFGVATYAFNSGIWVCPEKSPYCLSEFSMTRDPNILLPLSNFIIHTISAWCFSEKN